VKKLVLIGLIALLVVGFTSDAVRSVLSFMAENSEIKIGWAEFSDLNSIKCSYSMFTGTEGRIIRAEEGDRIQLNYSVTVSKGSIEIEVRDPAGGILWKHKFEKGSFADSLNIRINQSGWYRVIVKGENAGGSFDISWKVKRN
jgi:hypothetical protein